MYAPNVVSGNPVHWIYALPSDAPDRFSTFASQMQTDAGDDRRLVEEGGSDPRSAERPGRASVRTAARPHGSTSAAVERGARALGRAFRDALRRATRGRDSGRGSPSTSSTSTARSPRPTLRPGCERRHGFRARRHVRAGLLGASVSIVAAHEFLHTLGPSAQCSESMPRPERRAHVRLDERSDVPVPRRVTAGSEALDPGRDDYYGHSGTFTDSQDSPWLVQLDRQQPFMTTITGSGGVTADVPGLDCARAARPRGTRRRDSP